MTDSLQTARLDLNPRVQKKMDRITGGLGVDVIDEVGALAADLLHADALRRTYGRALRSSVARPEWSRESCPQTIPD